MSAAGGYDGAMTHDAAPPAGFAHHDAGPFLEHAGPVFRRAEDGALGLRIGERHLNSGGSAHGGLLTSVVDSAMGLAVRTEADGTPAVTVSLTTDFLGPAGPGDWIQTSTKVERVGGTLAFVDCSLRAGDREVVRGRAVFALLDGG